MIVFLLLVIIAILLFGSSAVIGAVGAFLGFVVLVLAVFAGIYWASTTLGIDSADMTMYVCVGIAIASFVLWMWRQAKKPL